MGFKCPVCGADHGNDKEMWRRHIQNCDKGNAMRIVSATTNIAEGRNTFEKAGSPEAGIPVGTLCPAAGKNRCIHRRHFGHTTLPYCAKYTTLLCQGRTRDRKVKVSECLKAGSNE